ncbi:MAG: lipopolysaccharide biosynthesis protein [Bacteroidales bacterium]|nr:lipopolysaccharide biosynthesis protein [Bacteroidales bacterium]
MLQSLKGRTAGTLKWNAIDRVASQLLYALTGVVLARLLSQEDFGLVGAVLVFQAFASLLVDSGFSYALIQRKRPSRVDYSTVLWFNLGVAVALYIILWFCAPLIADCFQGDRRIVPLARVMFLTFILNASAIVQTNRLVKRMDVRMVAIANSIGLAAGAVVGIWLAMAGYGAWAIVWQSIALSGVKSLVLWTTQRWRPRPVFSWKSLRGFAGIGSRMMFTSFLNTLFQNIYSFFIGNRVGLVSLGYYTQSDKWSKMGVMSIYQVVTSSFLPALSDVQDDPVRFRRVASKMTRFTAYLTFPALIGLMAVATPVFHMLFGTKWDPSIILFQLLLLRGVFTVLCGLYNNALLALGHARAIMWLEVMRDAVALGALAICFPYLAETRGDDMVWGLTLLLWGQVAASFLTWIATLTVTARKSGISVGHMLLDLAPYAAQSCVIAPLMSAASLLSVHPALQLLAACAGGGLLYLGINKLAGSQVQADLIDFVLRKKKL